MASGSPALVSIIMPAYNAEQYIHEAIRSVFDQTYPHWQLIIINDGSTDSTENRVLAFHDDRITYCRQDNRGVSAARNVGLANAQGEYFCFLDADDAMPPESLMDRVMYFERHPNVDFVDGIIYITGRQISEIKKVWTPVFAGNPQRDLVRLSGRCFVTISWMIRKRAVCGHRFQEGLSHAEDLIFLIDLSPGRTYSFIAKPILYYRRWEGSAMVNLDGLANGYCTMFKTLKRKRLFGNLTDRCIYKARMIKIMFLSFLAAGKYTKALRFIIKGVMA